MMHVEVKRAQMNRECRIGMSRTLVPTAITQNKVSNRLRIREV